MRFIFVILALFLLSAPASAQFWSSEPVKKPAPVKKVHKPKPVQPAAKEPVAPTPVAKFDPSQQYDIEKLVDPFAVLYTEKGEIAGCFDVKGSIRFAGIPRQPQIFVQECEETSRIGLTRSCGKYVFKEQNPRPTSASPFISFWDATGVYRAWSGPIMISPKRYKVQSSAQGCGK